MKKLTTPLLRELIDKIEVCETQDNGKNKTQRIAIYYRFVGFIEMTDKFLCEHYRSDMRQGVAVEYIPA